METLNITLSLLKSTKGTHVYGVTEDPYAPIQSVYIKRDSLPTPPPATLKVVIEAGA